MFFGPHIYDLPTTRSSPPANQLAATASWFPAEFSRLSRGLDGIRCQLHARCSYLRTPRHRTIPLTALPSHGSSPPCKPFTDSPSSRSQWWPRSCASRRNQPSPNPWLGISPAGRVTRCVSHAASEWPLTLAAEEHPRQPVCEELRVRLRLRRTVGPLPSRHDERDRAPERPRVRGALRGLAVLPARRAVRRPGPRVRRQGASAPFRASGD